MNPRFTLSLGLILTASAAFGVGDGPVLTDQKIDECIKDLQAGDLTHRELAAMTLRNCGAKTRKAVPALLQALDDADERVRAKASVTLGIIGIDSVEGLQ